MDNENDNQELAKNVLVFMAVVHNGHWKVPLGYFLIKSLNGEERAELLKKCLHLLYDTGAKTYSITFDGAPVNIKMCTSLGANFDYGTENFKPWFQNPENNENIYVIWDACHMIKLIRNTLGDKKVLIDGQGNYIKWEYIEKLWLLQKNEGLHAANKLTKKHINFGNNKMNVKLAAQTLSESVYNGLRFVESINTGGFKECLPTAEFCYIFDKIFDFLNCRNKYGRKKIYNMPIDSHNFDQMSCASEEFIKYIVTLKTYEGTSILQSERKTGFLGLIISLTNSLNIFLCMKSAGLKYLLTFKLSQDFLETFFCCIRGRGGFSKNPNAKQFETAYKRLLVRHQISTSINSNCLDDSTEILSVSSRKLKMQHPLGDITNINMSDFDNDYVRTMYSLSSFVENVTKYIAGFVAYKVSKRISCEVCRNVLFEGTTVKAPLIQFKNRVFFKEPTIDVNNICQVAERIIRTYKEDVKRKNSKEFLILKIFTQVQSIWQPFKNSEIMRQHISGASPFDNHQIHLIKIIIELFLSLRLFHEARIASEKDSYMRQKFTKLVQFLDH